MKLKRPLVLVEAGDGESSHRWRLPLPFWENATLGNRNEIGTGLYITALYYGKKTKRIIGKFYSIWEDRSRPGQIYGIYYRQLPMYELQSIAKALDIEPLVETIVDNYHVEASHQ